MIARYGIGVDMVYRVLEGGEIDRFRKGAKIAIALLHPGTVLDVRVEMRELTVSYGFFSVLKQVSMTVQEGGIAAILEQTAPEKRPC